MSKVTVHSETRSWCVATPSVCHVPAEYAVSPAKVGQKNQSFKVSLFYPNCDRFR